MQEQYKITDTFVRIMSKECIFNVCNICFQVFAYVNNVFHSLYNIFKYIYLSFLYKFTSLKCNKISIIAIMLSARRTVIGNSNKIDS